MGAVVAALVTAVTVIALVAIVKDLTTRGGPQVMGIMGSTVTSITSSMFS